MHATSRRRFLKQVGAGAALFSVGMRSAAAAQGAAGRPNVIVLLTDDQGYGDLGVNGNPNIDTPNLDQFTRDGVHLTRFYCSPVCAPTRSSLLTGRYYYRTGVIHTSRGGAKMHAEETTLAEILRDAGYATGIFGKWHLGDSYPMRPQDQGFMECLVHKSGGIGQTPDIPNSYFDPMLWHNGERVESKGYCTDVFVDAALGFIEKNRHKPFFVYLPTNAPHTPLEVDPKYVEPFTKQGIDETTARVYGMVKNIDENVGKLLGKLEALGLRENTLLLFFGDNGPQQARYTGDLRGRKTWIYEGGIRVPAAVQWPASIPGGRASDAIAAHIDVLPTVLDACGVATPSEVRLDGKSMLSVWRGEREKSPHERLFFQCHRGIQPQRYLNCAVVSQRWKLVGNPGTFTAEYPELPDEPALELYDLANDPGEQDNVADAHPSIVRELREAYDAWFDDVKGTRGFQAGIIHIGSPHENPVHLCRYQDMAYVDGKPTSWHVFAERAGRYEVTINRGDATAPGTLCLRANGRMQRQPLADGANTGIFTLPRGELHLDIWAQEADTPRILLTTNDTVGDVDIRYLGG